MDDTDLVDTRRALHALAELVLAGPQYAESEDIRLRVTPGGFGTRVAPNLRVEGAALVTSSVRVPLDSGGLTSEKAAEAVGVAARDLRDVYDDGPDLGAADPLHVDPEAASVILAAFARGDRVMHAFAPEEDAVLWPEHFDIGITVDEVNYGVSPGDADHAQPYAYVGPWAARRGDFWNAPFGAARPMSEIADDDALLEFFREGAVRAATDPPA